MTQLSVHNEWSRLEEVVLGLASELYMPALHPIDLEPINPWWRRVSATLLSTIAQGCRVPGWIQQKYVAELEALQRVLLEHRVTVHRPVPVAPVAEEPPGLGQMFARDPLIAVGGTLIAGSLQIDMRHKEARGLAPFMSSWPSHGTRVLAMTPDDGFLEGGDALIDWPFVYVGVRRYGSNLTGAAWLQRQLRSSVTVIPVPLAVSGILHLDCCMTLIGPRLGIIHREALAAPLPPPLDAYEFIEVDVRAQQELGTNVLVLDPRTIIVQSRHVQLQQRLRARGFRVIPLDFTWHARLGGAFRCATAPLRRN